MVNYCTKCGMTKPPDQFAIDRSKLSGRDSWCRTCRNKARRDRYHANLRHEQRRSLDYYEGHRGEVSAKRLKETHGMYPEQWHAMWEEQDGLCYLCEQPLPDDRSKIAVDHDHAHCGGGRSCGLCRRGLAHHQCNSAIGLLREDPDLLVLIASNLRRAQDTTRARMIAAPGQDELTLWADVV